jgi:hypothetical protein
MNEVKLILIMVALWVLVPIHRKMVAMQTNLLNTIKALDKRGKDLTS